MTNKRKKHVRAHAAKTGMSYQAALQSKPVPEFGEALAQAMKAPGVDLTHLVTDEDDLSERTFTDIFEMFDAMRAYAGTLGEGVEAIPCDSPPYLGYSVFKPATEAEPEQAALFQILVKDLSASLKRAEESDKPADYFYTSHTPSPPENGWPEDWEPEDRPDDWESEGRVKGWPVSNGFKARVFREFLKTATGRRRLGEAAITGKGPKTDEGVPSDP